MRAIAIPLLVYAAATVLLTWPMAGGAADRLFAQLDLNDSYLMIWILRWDLHALVTAPLRLFDANALHPAPRILATTEHLLGGLPFFAPVWAATANPVLAFNAFTLVTFVLCGIGMHVLARRWTGSEAAAYVAGLAFAFAPWRFPDGIGRAHLLHVEWFPPLFLCLDAVARTAELRPALGAAACLAMSALASYYVGYQAFALAGAFVVADAVVRGVRGRWRVYAGYGVAATTAVVALLPVTVPYLQNRAVGELAYAGQDPLAEAKLLALVGHPFLLLARWYAGWGLVAVAALGLVALATRDRARVAALVAAVVVGLVLGSGSLPIAGTWLTPYEWIAAVVPGFRNVRSPIRFGALLAFGLAGLAGYAVAAVPLRMRWFAAAVAAAAILWPVIGAPRLEGRHVPVDGEVPAVYRWLAEHGEGGTLLELPTRTPLGPAALGAQAMYFSTWHWLPLVNGYTGYVPSSFEFLERYARALPDPDALRLLANCTGLRWILAHAVPPDRRAAWAALPGTAPPRAFPVEARAPDQLYEVRLSSDGACAPRLFTDGVTADGNVIPPRTPLRGRIGLERPLDTIVAGHESRIDVTVENTSTELWPATSPRIATRVGLRVRWIAADGSTSGPADEIPLADDVAPGERRVVGGWLRHPPASGAYRLRLVLGWSAPESDDVTWERAVVVTDR